MNKTKIRAMVSIAYSDGFFDSRELFLINKRAKDLGLENEEILKIIRSPEEGNNIMPVTDLEKLEFMYHLMELIYADKKVEEDEKRMFYKYLNVLNFKSDIHDDFYEMVLSSVIEDLDFNSFKEKNF